MQKKQTLAPSEAKMSEMNSEEAAPTAEQAEDFAFKVIVREPFVGEPSDLTEHLATREREKTLQAYKKRLWNFCMETHERLMWFFYWKDCNKKLIPRDFPFPDLELKAIRRQLSYLEKRVRPDLTLDEIYEVEYDAESRQTRKHGKLLCKPPRQNKKNRRPNQGNQ